MYKKFFKYTLNLFLLLMIIYNTVTMSYYIQQINTYLSKTRFAPFCIGFFGMSGTIGKRRAKRAIHLLEKTAKNADASDFLIYALSNLI